MAGKGIVFFVATACAVGLTVPLYAGTTDSGSTVSHCRDESIAYVSALAQCEKGHPAGTKPRGEAECFESFGPLSALMSCEMKAVEGLQDRLVRLGNSMRKLPPGNGPVVPDPSGGPKTPLPPSGTVIVE